LLIDVCPGGVAARKTTPAWSFRSAANRTEANDTNKARTGSRAGASKRDPDYSGVSR